MAPTRAAKASVLGFGKIQDTKQQGVSGWVSGGWFRIDLEDCAILLRRLNEFLFL